MSETRKAIIISTGMDNLPLLAKLKENETLTGASLDRIKGLYAKLAAEKATIEAKENDASLARLAKNMEAKAALSKAWIEKDAAMRAIASGSGGAGSGFQTAEHRALAGGEGLITGFAGAKLAGGAVKEVAHEAHGFAGIMRETAVIFREGFRGNFTRMIGSTSLLIGMIGKMAAAVAIPLAAILAIPGFKAWQAKTAEAESGKRLQEKVVFTAESLRELVRHMQETGVLSKSNAQGMLVDLEYPTFESVSSILSETNPLLKQQVIADAKKNADKLAASEQKELDELLNKKRDEKTIEQDIADKKEAIAFLTQNIAANEADSLEAHEAKARKLGYEIELQKDLTKHAEFQRKAAEETAKWKEWSNRAARDYMKNQINAAMDEAQYPSLEDMAGRRFTKRLEKNYEAGGIYDLGRGDGPYAANAQDYLLAQKQQIWDREHGNLGAAEADRQRMIAERNYLVGQGVASPTMLLSKIGEDTDKLRTLFDALTKSGALATTIASQ